MIFCGERPTIEELTHVREWVNTRFIFNKDYTWGYTSALIDVVNLIDSDYIVRMFKGLGIPRNHKNLIKFFRFLLYNREYLRSGGRGDYIGYDEGKKDFILRRCGNEHYTENL
ncbi:MAG: hypothetical protein HDQ88_12115 [Clostridia bacterium]|nr:hypothetical protein [Clostridia bacterium]